MRPQTATKQNGMRSGRLGLTMTQKSLLDAYNTHNFSNTKQFKRGEFFQIPNEELIRTIDQDSELGYDKKPKTLSHFEQPERLTGFPHFFDSVGNIQTKAAPPDAVENVMHRALV